MARLRDYGPAAAVFVVVLVAWEAIVRALGIQQFLLPPPSAIASAFADHFEELMTVGRNTLVEAVGGLLIGGTAALAVAFSTARWTVASRALLPFAIAANSVPIIAFAPIMNNWFGILNPLSKMMVVAGVGFFPSKCKTGSGCTPCEASRPWPLAPDAPSRDLAFANCGFPGRRRHSSPRPKRERCPRASAPY